MDFIEGIPILQMGDEMTKRGINPNGSVAKNAKRLGTYFTAQFGNSSLFTLVQACFIASSLDE